MGEIQYDSGTVKASSRFRVEGWLHYLSMFLPFHVMSREKVATPVSVYTRGPIQMLKLGA
jgi:hypothetical protein